MKGSHFDWYERVEDYFWIDWFEERWIEVLVMSGGRRGEVSRVLKGTSHTSLAKQ